MERIPEDEAIATMEDARRFNEMMGKGMMRREYRELAQAVIKMGVPKGGKVLDIGTGPGFVALELAQLLQGEVQVVGLDLSVVMLTIAAENAERRGLANWVHWEKGDAAAMPYEDGELDFVVSSGSLHHWDDPIAIFDEIERVLKPDGQCIVQDLKRVHRGFSRLFVWAIGLMIPKDFRVHYYGSIHSSYMPDELRKLLKRSRLTGWRVDEDFMGLQVVKDAGGGGCGSAFVVACKPMLLFTRQHDS